MTKLYKLAIKTEEGIGVTYACTKWKVGTKHVLRPIENPKLCTEDVFHAYRDLDLGLIMNPIHADFNNFIIFEAEGEICVEEWDKCGTFELKILREIPIPEWYADLNTRLQVYKALAEKCKKRSWRADSSFDTICEKGSVAYYADKALIDIALWREQRIDKIALNTASAIYETEVILDIDIDKLIQDTIEEVILEIENREKANDQSN